MKAIEERADFIETHILGIKDVVLICSLDATLNLDNRTNIANFNQFVDRKRTYEVQGVNMTGCMSLNFWLNSTAHLYIKSFFIQKWGYKSIPFIGFRLLW